MKLFIHFGIYKAGSSYLQYICANRREELRQAGIWFPFSPDDTKMKSGSISAGNAFELSEWLKRNKKTEIESYLAAIKKEANKNNCECVLLTAEALVHQFAREDRLKLLEQTALKIGFGKIHALGYFRDPVDHCISLYKHRSKSGKNPDFEYWVREVYETPRVLNDFFRVHTTVDIKWTLRKFKKDADYMIQSFFEEWLGVKITDIPHKPKVNESITLSEVMIMQHLKKFFPYTLDYVLKRLINLPKSKKASGKSLEALYVEQASDIIHKQYFRDIQLWNNHFDEGNKLQYEKVPGITKNEITLSLSIAQMKTLINAVVFLSGSKSLALRMRRRIKRLLPSKFLKTIMRKR